VSPPPPLKNPEFARIHGTTSACVWKLLTARAGWRQIFSPDFLMLQFRSGLGVDPSLFCFPCPPSNVHPVVPNHYGTKLIPFCRRPSAGRRKRPDCPRGTSSFFSLFPFPSSAFISGGCCSLASHRTDLRGFNLFCVLGFGWGDLRHKPFFLRAVFRPSPCPFRFQTPSRGPIALIQKHSDRVFQRMSHPPSWKTASGDGVVFFRG